MSQAGVLSSSGSVTFPVSVSNGGTGDSSVTAYAPICGGTTSTAAFQSAATGFSNSGYVLTSNGSSALPSWKVSSGGSGIQTIDGNTGSVTGNTVTITGSPAGATVSFSGSGTTLSLNTDTSSGIGNIAIGAGTGIGSGEGNAIFGNGAFSSAIGGSYNCLFGQETGFSLTYGNGNCVFGQTALGGITTGSYNIVIGSYNAGNNYASSESSNILINNVGVIGESNVIRIGTQGSGTPEQNACYIAGITGTSIIGGAAVLCNASGNLGTVVSSQRYKENIEDIGDSSNIHNLRPVSFNYKSDKSKELHYGLIAEEVNVYFPKLIINDSQGRPDSVKYHEMPALLINEIKKLKDEIDVLKASISAMRSK